MVGFEVIAAPVVGVLSLAALVLYCAFQPARRVLLWAALAGALVGGMAGVALAVLLTEATGGMDFSGSVVALVLIAGGIQLGAYVAVGIVAMTSGPPEVRRAARWGAVLALAGAALLLELARRQSPPVGRLEATTLFWLYPPLLLSAGAMGSLIGAQVAIVRAWDPARRNRLLIRLAVAAAVLALGFNYAHARHRAAELNYMSQSHDLRGLVGVLQTGNKSDRYVAACLLRNAWLGDYPQVILPLLLAQQDPDTRVRQAAQETLQKFGQAQVQEALAQAARQGDAETRYQVVLRLGQMSDEQALSPLMMALQDPDPRVRWAAQKGMNRRGYMPAPAPAPPVPPPPCASPGPLGEPGPRLLHPPRAGG